MRKKPLAKFYKGTYNANIKFIQVDETYGRKP